MIQHINIVFDSGGIGDCIARLVPILYIQKYHPNIIVHLFVPDFFKEFAIRCINTKQVIVKSFSDLQKKPKILNKSGAMYAYAKFETRCNNLASHMVDHAFFIMNFQPIDTNDKNYPKVNLEGISIDRFNLPERYAVLSTGYTSEVREFLPEHINKISTFLLEQGITPVYLGKGESHNGVGHVIKPVFKEDIDFSKGVNLINQTTLLESAKIIEKSKFLLGLDNGLHHIAGCVDEVPIVMGLTTVLKEHRMPYRKGVLGYNVYPVEATKEELDCIACQSTKPFAYGHKFTTCYTKTKKCLEIVNADKYIVQIKKLL